MEENKSGNNNSAVLEGMYKGVAGKLDEVRQSVSRELQYSSTQQAYAYEALTEDFKKGVETVLAELRYLSQQNSSIYADNRRDRDALKDAVSEAVREKTTELMKDVLETVDARLSKFKEELDKEREVDYERLADLIASRLAPKDVEETVAPSEGPSEVSEAEASSEAVEVEEPVEKSEELSEVPAESEVREEKAPARRVLEYDDETFEYDILAEKIASILPETDYDLLADKVCAALPQSDADAVADRVVAILPQLDEQSIADRVAENIPLTDYDLIAERIAALLEGETTVKLNEESIERIAVRVAELLNGSLPAEAAVSSERAPAPSVVAPVAVPVSEEDAELTTRYKRSFVAKIIESDDDVKKYYSDLKNVLLSYGKVRSQINWTNDRFSFEQEPVAKIGIRGKTLCIYLALDPKEFPETVYHQKFAGDTKMYEKTPMMVKIKSGVAVKRATRLIELLAERLGAVKEEREPVDYAAQYFFRTEEELLAEGLIKTAVVEKSDLNF